MKRQRGLGLFEFAVVLVIFGILAAVLLDRLIEVERETERLEVELTLRHVHIGLKLAIGEHIMRGEESRIAELLERDPLEFLAPTKVGAGGTAPTDRWHYDPASRRLGYRPRQPEAFDGNHHIEWRYAGHRDALGRTVGLRLEPLAGSVN